MTPLPRYRQKRDENEPAIIRALSAAGCSVTKISPIGGGVPDLLVGRAGRNFLLEVKCRNMQSPSHQKLTKPQEEWHGTWRGQKAVVFTVEEALSVINGENDAED